MTKASIQMIHTLTSNIDSRTRSVDSGKVVTNFSGGVGLLFTWDSAYITFHRKSYTGIIEYIKQNPIDHNISSKYKSNK